jgi:hypothetical protein
MMKRKVWSEHERQILIEMFADNYTETICSVLNRSYGSVSSQSFMMGLKKSDAFHEMEMQRQAERLKTSGKEHRFTKGSIPSNKGKKMSDEVYEKVKNTMFKKSKVPHNAYQVWHEVLRKDKCGKDYWMIKLPGEKKLKYKHIWLYECKYGKVKKGFNVAFIDGNSLNCTIENLECISNADLMRRNTIHRFPKELKSTIRLVNKLKRTINGKEQN